LYRVGIDTGGTFTDLVAISHEGTVVVAKHPSTPRAPVDAFMRVIGKSGLASGAGEIERIAHGTTVATNAVIQRQGAPVILIATRGFEDVPFIQRINRKSEYDLHWRKPQPLVRRRCIVGVRERINARGEVTQPLTADAIEEVVAAIRPPCCSPTSTPLTNWSWVNSSAWPFRTSTFRCRTTSLRSGGNTNGRALCSQRPM
jgi:N-methylhydantoinase A